MPTLTFVFAHILARAGTVTRNPMSHMAPRHAHTSSALQSHGREAGANNDGDDSRSVIHLPQRNSAGNLHTRPACTVPTVSLSGALQYRWSRSECAVCASARDTRLSCDPGRPAVNCSSDDELRRQGRSRAAGGMFVDIDTSECRKKSGTKVNWYGQIHEAV